MAGSKTQSTPAAVKRPEFDCSFQTKHSRSTYSTALMIHGQSNQPSIDRSSIKATKKNRRKQIHPSFSQPFFPAPDYGAGSDGPPCLQLGQVVSAWVLVGGATAYGTTLVWEAGASEEKMRRGSWNGTAPGHS